MSNICDTLVYSSFIARSTRHISSLTFSGATFFRCPFGRKCASRVLIWCNFYWLLCLVWRFPASRGWGWKHYLQSFPVSVPNSVCVSGTMDFIWGINVHINKSLMCEIQAGHKFSTAWHLMKSFFPKETGMKCHVEPEKKPILLSTFGQLYARFATSAWASVQMTDFIQCNVLSSIAQFSPGWFWQSIRQESNAFFLNYSST